MKQTKIIRRSYSDKIFDVANVIIMLLMLVIFVWPLWFVVIASFSHPEAVNMGKVLLWPKDITLLGYERMFKHTELWIGYRNSIFYTVVGTIVNMVMSVFLAYPISDKSFMPRKILMYFFLITMYFGGGMIPTYLVVRDLGLIDTPWAMIIPGAVSVYNSLILRNYFMNSIPNELEEASMLDGANAADYLWSVVLPLSKPVLAVVALYYAVGHWNDYYTALIYINSKELRPLQSVLRDLLIADQALNDLSGHVDPNLFMKALHESMQMKYSIIIAAALPMLCAYPFVQKYFVKGVMIGSIKG